MSQANKGIAMAARKSEAREFGNWGAWRNSRRLVFIVTTLHPEPWTSKFAGSIFRESPGGRTGNECAPTTSLKTPPHPPQA